jgi:hypothetical protein
VLLLLLLLLFLLLMMSLLFITDYDSFPVDGAHWTYEFKKAVRK